VAEAGGEEVRVVAERLVASLDAPVRLVIIEGAGRGVRRRRAGDRPGLGAPTAARSRSDIVVVAAPIRPETVDQPASDRHCENGDADDLTDGPMARINFRPPEALKARIEQAAARERLSVNAWLVRTTSPAVDARPGTPPTSTRNHISGWVG
jgi:hypothetical protein